jgi:hypothetical protein
MTVLAPEARNPAAVLLRQCVLPPLAPAEAARLLAVLLPEKDDAQDGARRRTLRRAGGVPFFLVSCAQEPR